METLSFRFSLNRSSLCGFLFAEVSTSKRTPEIDSSFLFGSALEPAPHIQRNNKGDKQHKDNACPHEIEQRNKAEKTERKSDAKKRLKNRLLEERGE